ncbi:hypothetical protein EJ02DRAFT_419747 [Clathrospora elynae]|uniref:Uncharacterized protein n=1 Tax=Clathrospora elynae TaxID=706981 RepID=A0A6A5SZ94_9PLEO|nr:hypothetical protein EJ02DRAFT_419747 [Clathrospora elynae]
MSSFLDKLRGKSNPYKNTHHLGHNPNPALTSKNAPENPASFTQKLLPRRPASPPDLLAEARQLAGRDPVTGKRHAYMIAQTASERQQHLAEVRQSATDERTAYRDRAAKTQQTPGQRYDLFVQEMVAKRDGDAVALRAVRGGAEYYAPERRVEEFYAERVRD